MQPFTRNMEDNSTEAGFQFTFFCDICNAGYKTEFIPSKTYKKGSVLRGLGKAASAAGGLVARAAELKGLSDISRAADSLGGAVSDTPGIISERFEGMPPAWHKEHEAAFATAVNEAKTKFQRCPRCRQWVCENDWNDEEGLCVDDAPRVAAEVAAAKAQTTKEQIWEKARETKLFTGKVESKQTICPECGKPSGGGKFCNNCGAPLSLNRCPKCGAANPAGTRFCGECGSKLK
ncbi:MAG: zinc ribbon domain-containing protein [Candidatus Freyarchaeota archaeon]